MRPRRKASFSDEKAAQPALISNEKYLLHGLTWLLARDPILPRDERAGARAGMPCFAMPGDTRHIGACLTGKPGTARQTGRIAGRPRLTGNRTSRLQGKCVYVSVEPGGRSFIKKKTSDNT